MFTTPISDLTDRREPTLEGEIPALSAEALGIDLTEKTDLTDKVAVSSDRDVA